MMPIFVAGRAFKDVRISRFANIYFKEGAVLDYCMGTYTLGKAIHNMAKGNCMSCLYPWPTKLKI